jgi:hypothetical protein
VTLQPLPGRSLRRDITALQAALALASTADTPRLLELMEEADEPLVQLLGEFFVATRTREAVPALRRYVGTDYRDSPRFARLLAALGDCDVLEWARDAFSADPQPDPLEHDWGAHRYLPAMVVACSPLPEADALAGEIIKAGGLHAKWLAEGYRDSTVPARVWRQQELDHARY